MERSGRGEKGGIAAAPALDPERAGIARKLDAARQDLLDLGLRNSLLNYRLLKTRGVEVVDELPDEAFRLLVREGKLMSFQAQTTGEGGMTLAQPGEDTTVATTDRHGDTRLQTSLTSPNLQARLLMTYYTSRTLIEEQGVNTLFLALGMLRWYESDESMQPRMAPLVLIPVELDRSNARARFHLRYTGEDVGANLSLAAKLKQEFGVTLPPLPELEDLDIEAYCDQVAQTVERETRWSVQRDAILLGFFSFAKLLMFKDLELDAWPEDGQPIDDPILQALLRDGFRDGESPYGEDDDLDALPPAGDLHPVMDADSSQTLAILDVKEGRNLVIQGPPGTGKSQTIANIIAEALAAGKKVLFVAEKMAALEVVKRRLDRIELGDACLELHSNKTNKKILLAELSRTLDLGKPRLDDPDGQQERLLQSRDRLNAYAAAINDPIGRSGVTPYQALWQIARLSQRYGDDVLVRIDLPAMASWTGQQYRERESLVEELQATLRSAGIPDRHPFWGCGRTSFPRTECVELRALLTTGIATTNWLQREATVLSMAAGVAAPDRPADAGLLFPRGWQLVRRWFGKDKPARAAVRSAVAAHDTAIRQVVEYLALDEKAFFGDGPVFDEQTFQEQVDVLDAWRQGVAHLSSLAAFTLRAQECRAVGLSPVVEVAQNWGLAVTNLLEAFHHSWFSTLLGRAYGERMPLAQFGRDSHEEALRRFRQLDASMPRRNSVALAREHFQNLPHRDGGGQLAVLKREFEKKSRHLPIRQLMVKAGMAIQAIKPVFMMSPLSVANFLPPGSLGFDLVVFDEASQVKPVDAFGALLRGRQAVVVGDERQLPPTRFFDSLTSGEDIDEENTTAEIESILGLFSAQLAPERMLRWHYRSRHESLIAVSNHAFYRDRLVVFPSPDAARNDAGLIYHRLENSSYDRGKTRTNQIEAEAVAQAVMEHARTRPQLSLGVAAFSVAQMQAILDQLEILRRTDPACEEFFSSAHPHEHFFVKNLESVQGDERDVIFISVGYGRTAEGYLAMSFGPLNGDGGERRLNVLITRARVRCEVFTNLTSDDIEADGRGAGVRALKLFLKYAETGRLDVPVDTDREADSPFEEAVEYALRSRGYTVKRQVGSAGFRIDLAVVDPERPGRYILGVECDGAAYHSARSARDRDRLRQQVLEGLGWTLHRIWSTDWFRDSESEIDRLAAAIEAARSPLPAKNSPRLESSAPAEINVERESAVNGEIAETPAVAPYRQARLTIFTGGRELHAVPASVLAGYVTRVVEAESPVHVSEVARRVANAAGVRRIGSRIEAAIAVACRYAVSNHLIRRQGEFLWQREMQAPIVRSRRHLPVASRRLELVAPEEIALGIQHVVRNSYGIEPEQIPAAVCRMFGFQRLTGDMRERIDEVLNLMIRAGQLTSKGGYLVVAARDA